MKKIRMSTCFFFFFFWRSSICLFKIVFTILRNFKEKKIYIYRYYFILKKLKKKIVFRCCLLRIKIFSRFFFLGYFLEDFILFVWHKSFSNELSNFFFFFSMQKFSQMSQYKKKRRRKKPAMKKENFFLFFFFF